MGMQIEPAPSLAPKKPRTERGRQTLRRLLDAAALEFGEKGFHDASVSGITARAGTALGTFYTYFDSKEALFRALVTDLSDRVRDTVVADLKGAAANDAIDLERAAFAAFLRFVREHKEIYRIIDEAEFADPASYRAHYETTARRMFERLRKGSAAGQLRNDLTEAHAWAIMGMNVFLGLRYAVWSADGEVTGEVADVASSILRHGIRTGNTPD